MKYPEELPLAPYFSDNYGAYMRNLPEKRHITGKTYARKIKRKNLSFRTHLKRLNRKTICYSRNELIHDNVIGTYIERFHFKPNAFNEKKSIVNS
jgi:insertion element IS1 protein InsB